MNAPLHPANYDWLPIPDGHEGELREMERCGLETRIKQLAWWDEQQEALRTANEKPGAQSGSAGGTK